MTAFRLNFIPLFLLPFVRLPAAFCEPSSGSAPWRTLTTVQSAFGVTNYAWDGDSLCFSNSQSFVRFYQGRRKSDVNGTTVWLNALPDGSVNAGNWRLSGVDLDFLQLALLPHEEGEMTPVRVTIDPGHGGEDKGASSKNPVLHEKDLTLALATQIGKKLEAAGLTVAYTRTNDATLTLDDRSRLARKASSDVFVSVHANYAGNADAAGVETYVLPPSGYPGTADGSRPRGWQIGNRNDFHNTLLGYSVHRKLVGLNEGCDRGLKRQSFFVLRETSCPAVLLEFGFLSNQAETRKMLAREWQERCAAAVSEGILSYARKVGALDKAVADKRKREAEANERWRLRLAAQAAKPHAPLPPPALSNAASAAAGLAPALSNSLCIVAARFGAAASTNAAPAELNTLIDFYESGKVE
jgi:N-acetylmuramoyl-L-alanine amidase